MFIGLFQALFLLHVFQPLEFSPLFLRTFLARRKQPPICHGQIASPTTFLAYFPRFLFHFFQILPDVSTRIFHVDSQLAKFFLDLFECDVPSSQLVANLADESLSSSTALQPPFLHLRVSEEARVLRHEFDLPFGDFVHEEIPR
ncbi:hypothetical protein IW261DRAFT_168427 [Armillaria novae-zelandiae]|uniref:Secreted protein n=1 Tax=Armillaria novae-zelandiae TaxID=153914 RepID=A0AA39UEG3_9AGAR|nr:hypothetical protein IW261DRAFT_168427 [Armillaria novae-zelandiae]